MALRKKKLTVAQVGEVIESEGLGYAIQSYLSADRIADHDLADMWERAANLLNEIEQYIEDNVDEIAEIDEADEDYDPEDDNFGYEN